MKLKLTVITFYFFSLAAYGNYCNTIDLQGKLNSEIKQNIRHRYNRELDLLKLHDNFSESNALENLIVKAIQPFGYVNPKIQTNIKPSSACRKISALIALGPPTIIKTIQSNQKIPTTKLKIGQRFKAKDYQQTLNKLTHHFKENGYRNVDLSQSKVIIDPKTNTAKIFLKINLGQQFRFGKIKIIAKNIDNKILNKYLVIKESEPYSITKIQTTQEYLMNSGYFKKVEIITLDQNITKNKPNATAKATIPVTIKTTPIPKFQTVIGIGYDSVDSIKTIFNYRILANKAGHIINSISSLSKNNTLFQMQYLIPDKIIRDAKFIFKTSYLINHVQNDKSFIMTASYAKKNEHGDLSYGLNAIHNQQIINSSKIIANIVYPFFNNSRKYITNILGHASKQNWGISGIFAKQGMASNLDIIQMRTNFYNKVTLNEQIRMVFAGQLGVNYTNDPSKQPLPTMLTLGGNNGLRGYPFNSITDRTDQLQILRALSLELQKKVAENIYATAFMDIGQVSKNFKDDWLRSIGVGAVYNTPIGDININLAKPLDFAPDMTHRNIRLAISYTI